jgi:hypothetical protein
MFLVPNIDQMYKEMKKIVEVGNKHGNGDEFTFFFFLALINHGSNIAYMVPDSYRVDGKKW